MRVLVRDLQPGVTYAVQFKVRTTTQESDWSQKMEFATSNDILGPAAVTGLTLTVEGTSFLAKWNKVTTNTNGSALTDFKDYEIAVTSGATTVTYFTTAERFDFTFEMNKAAFGTPAPSISVAVRARDNALNAVAVGTTASAANPVPSIVTSFAGQSAVNSINFTWAKNSDLDLKYYRLYRGATSGTATTLTYEGLANNYTYSSTNFAAPEYFRLASVDVFGQETFAANTIAAAPLAYDNKDVTPPADPTWPGGWVSTETDLSNRAARRVNATLTWNANSESDLGAYVLQYKKAADSVWTEQVISGTATNPPATTTKVNGLASGITYNFRVAARDKSGNTSNFVNSPSDLATGNDTTPPSTPSTPTVTNFIGQLLVTWNGLNSTGASMESDTERVEVHIFTTSGFTPSNATLNTYFSSAYSNKPQQAIISRLTYGTTYYIKLVAVDFSGNASPASAQASGTPVKAQEGDIASINAGQITTGELAAGVRVIAGPELGTHAELTSTGLRVFAQDDADGIPNEVIRLGTDTNDYFGIAAADGTLLASIDDQGSVNAQKIAVAGQAGRGMEIYGTDFQDWIDQLPRGVVGRFYLTTNRTVMSSAEYGIVELDYSLPESMFGKTRMYRAVMDAYIDHSAAGIAQILFRMTTDGSLPTVTSQIFNSGAYNNYRDGLNRIRLETNFHIGNSTDLTLRMLWSGRVAAGGSWQMIGSTQYPAYFYIEDVGPYIPSDDGFASGGGGSAETPSGTPPKATYVKTYTASWTRTFKGDGSARTDTTDAVQGYQSSNGRQKAMIGFPAFTGAVGAAAISRVEVYLYANHWYANSGGTATIGVHGQASVPATFSTSGGVTSSGWPKPGGRWVTLPSSYYAAFISGANKGITLTAPSDSTLYYGRFNGSAASSNKPLVRITYTR